MQLDGKADVWRWMTSDRRFAVDRFTVRTATRAGCILWRDRYGRPVPGSPRLPCYSARSMASPQNDALISKDLDGPSQCEGVLEQFGVPCIVVWVNA